MQGLHSSIHSKIFQVKELAISEKVIGVINDELELSIKQINPCCMKNFTKVLNLAVTFVLCLTSCSLQEPVGTVDNTPYIYAADGPEEHPRPAPQCGPSVYYSLVDNTGSTTAPATLGGSTYGVVELANDPQFLWVIPATTGGWYISASRIWCSTAGSCPAADQSLGVEQFPYQNQISPSRSTFQIQIPMSANAQVVDLILCLTAHKVNAFSQPVNYRQLWGQGETYYNGFRMNGYSYYGCAAAPDPVIVSVDANCTTVLTGLPASVNGGSTCATLTATGTSGTTPYIYSWSTGASTPSITVCGAATYYVTITDAMGASSVGSVSIQAINIRCGNQGGGNPAHKVMVCHLPPGNPANRQDICIDWSGVPAHVAAYRPSTANPNMGHDSGCYLGPCGSSACGSN
jgi:hypothetical protein